MNVLVLGPRRPALFAALERAGDRVASIEDRLSPEGEPLRAAEFLVSYGYRYILPGGVLRRFPGRAINLHVSLLPWNRGADPNLWSFLEDTPKGVTIHAMEEKVDRGPVLCQKEISFREEKTLKTTYERLSSEIEGLLRSEWPLLRSGGVAPRPQAPGGSFHRSEDKKIYEPLLTLGWETPVASLVGKAFPGGRP